MPFAGAAASAGTSAISASSGVERFFQPGELANLVPLEGASNLKYLIERDWTAESSCDRDDDSFG